MKEMSGIVAQAFGVGIAFPVGIVGLLEASKNLGADSADAGLYGFIALPPRIRRVVGLQDGGARQAQGGARGQGPGHVHGG